MAYVINLYSLAPTAMWVGYLKSYDPDYREDGAAIYPTGYIEVTADPAEAMHFAGLDDAVELINLQSRRVPYRADGRPNRPITAYTIEVVAREEETT